ncbi:hypothetical protein N2152v2_001575 [Parachlorella kessleri]
MQQVKAVLVPSPTSDHPCKRPRVDSPAEDRPTPDASSLGGLRQQLHLQPPYLFHGGFLPQSGTPPSEGQMRPPSPTPTPMPAATASGGAAAPHTEDQQLSQQGPQMQQQAQPLLQPCSQANDEKPSPAARPTAPLSPFAAPDAAALFFQQQQGQSQQGCCPPDRLRDSRDALLAAALSSLPSTAVPPVPALRRGLPCMPSGIPPLQPQPSGALPVLPPEVRALLGQMASAPSPAVLPPGVAPSASPGLGPQQQLAAWTVEQAAAEQEAQQGAVDSQQAMEAAMDGALGVAVNLLLSLQSRVGACEVGAAGAERQLLLMRQSLAKLADVVTKLNRNWQRVVNSHHAQLRLLWELQQRSKDASPQGEGDPAASRYGGVGISPETASALQALVLHQASFMQALQEERAHGARLEARNARLEARVAALERALGHVPC